MAITALDPKSLLSSSICKKGIVAYPKPPIRLTRLCSNAGALADAFRTP